MKHIKTWVVFIVLNSLLNPTFSQKKNQFGIGDKIPDFLFENLKNNKDKTVKASQLYKKGILIINFWATWCIPCIREMPRTNELAKKNKDKLSFICISKESENDVDLFFERNKNFESLPVLANDTILNKYFPHRVIPHNVWIDSTGTIKAITDDYEITQTNIDKFLKGENNLSIKNEIPNFNPSERLDTTNSYFSSVVKPALNIGSGGEIYLDSTSSVSRYFGWNCYKAQLFWSAFMNRHMYMRDLKLIVLNVKDSDTYIPPYYKKGYRDEEWINTHGTDSLKKFDKKYLYCYELSFGKKIEPQNFYSLMQSELCTFFDVKVSREPRLANSWVITKINDKIYKHTSKILIKKPIEINGITLIGTNQTMDEIAKMLSFFYPTQPMFVNETGLTIRIDLYKDFTDHKNPGVSIEKLKLYLNEIGLDINIKERMLPHLVISNY